MPSSGEICKFCTISETEHLSVSPPRFSLTSISPLVILFSSILYSEQPYVNEMTSSISNHPAFHRSMLILLYPLVRYTRLFGSLLHSFVQSIIHQLPIPHFIFLFTYSLNCRSWPCFFFSSSCSLMSIDKIEVEVF